ncbi:hypothetical protein H4W31_001926 [Plantactinospora soyae]|uniref:Uncharacterized protein n=1 Tax=Plantactinospora soyae TaxID=1544732 RepID=A0A927M178_9ACTN|nr:hypothetical protein [Plantactinospora soyae]
MATKTNRNIGSKVASHPRSRLPGHGLPDH